MSNGTEGVAGVRLCLRFSVPVHLAALLSLLASWKPETA